MQQFENSLKTTGKALCQEILRGFRLISYSETNRELPCETGSPFDSSQSEHTDPLKIRTQTGGKKVFSHCSVESLAEQASPWHRRRLCDEWHQSL